MDRTTRREFLSASLGTSGAALAGALAPLASVAAPGPIHQGRGGGRRLATVPFVDEGPTPLGRVLGSGLGGRRVLDLSTVGPDTLITPNHSFYIRTRAPQALPAAATWQVRLRDRTGGARREGVLTLPRAPVRGETPRPPPP